MQTATTLDQALLELRQLLHGGSRSAPMMDHGERREQIARNDIVDGYGKEAGDLTKFIEAFRNKGIFGET